MKEEKGNGKRFNKGKVPLDLITPYTTLELAKVLDFGANVKGYGRDNWTKGMPWSTVIASLKRHITAIELGEDIDPDSGYTYHAAHIMCNAMFLLEYYRIYPEGDDRAHEWKRYPKVALDIDGTIADFSSAYSDYMRARGYEVPEVAPHWNFPYGTKEVWQECIKDKEFWVNLKPLVDGRDLPFEPVGYVTYREIPTEWTEEWLAKNHFPCMPVITIDSKDHSRSKAEAIRSLGADTFVDDKMAIFVDLNKQGINCYLKDQPYNRKYKVGFKRIKDFTELVR